MSLHRYAHVADERETKVLAEHGTLEIQGSKRGKYSIIYKKSKDIYKKSKEKRFETNTNSDQTARMEDRRKKLKRGLIFDDLKNLKSFIYIKQQTNKQKNIESYSFENIERKKDTEIAWHIAINLQS